ncbi:hypothetical protein SK128_017639 [Halocaridina rubra]|uniref:Alpha-1,3-mannosyl-glycoprotein 2-beta-N-acetylglucosaminyltransferase n=1 Tax=Halocaridina rubra TaxID=373956 RepID=A0AAN8XHH3_HALRR
MLLSLSSIPSHNSFDNLVFNRAEVPDPTRHRPRHHVRSTEESSPWVDKLYRIYISSNALKVVYFPAALSRLWIDSLSSPNGWSLSSGKCLTTEKHRIYSQVKDCDPSQASFHQGWQQPKSKNATVRDAAQEGLTLSVLNQRRGNLILHKVYPLWQYWAHWADLQWYMQQISPGRIVVMTVSVSGVIGLRHVATLLQELGSVLAQHLTPLAHWTWIFVKGGRTIGEAGVLHNPGANAYLHSQVQFSDIPPRYIITKNQLEQRRWHYCENEDAMGSLCDEHTPFLLPLPQAPRLSDAAEKVLSEVPVILAAGSRHHYLYYSLTKLLAAPGAHPENILVVLGHTSRASKSVLNLLGVKYTTMPVQGHTNDNLYKYYRSVYQLINNTFTHAPAVIILDEDVEVSPDFFSYMSQTLWLLQDDPTVYCINAFSPIGGRGLHSRKENVLRGSVQVEWGYAISLNFVREALQQWKIGEHTNTLLYDFWLYLNVRNKRECIFPEATRSKHFGMGVNTIGYLKEVANFGMKLLDEAPVHLSDVDALEKSVYATRLSHKIRIAKPLLKEPCDPEFLPNKHSVPYYVFYYRLDPIDHGRRPDFYQYFQPSECLGLWSVSEQGHHDGVTTVRFAPNATLFLVGVPFSSYSYLKPQHIPLWDVDAITDEKFFYMTKRTDLNQKIQIKNTNTSTDIVLKELMLQ